MRAVVQRVTGASVTIAAAEPRAIGPGLTILLGVRAGDDESDALALAHKIAHLRVFVDHEERMNLSLKDTGGAALVVSNFTLYGDCRHGRRPSFAGAARPEIAQGLVDTFIRALRELIPHVETGEFQAKMEVTLTNEGPVTLLLDTEKRI